jgi:hypothetical protein
MLAVTRTGSGIAVLEECSSASFGSPESPARATARELILACAHADQAAKLATLQKAVELLNVAAETMIVADHDLAARLLCRGQYTLHPARGQRQRPLTQHVDFRFQSAKNMGLVQVVRRSNHDRIDLIELEQILEISEHVGDLQPFGDRAGLRSVVVAERDELRALELRQDRKMSEL